MSMESPAAAPAVGALVQGLLERQVRSLARAITLVENQAPGSAALLAAIQPHLGGSHVVGVTGPPGAGKSTLISALIQELRRRDQTVGVLAVDPSSPISGGAILGDRVRMESHTADPGVFVRSLASRGHLGGLVRAAWGVVQVLDAYGPDYILLETVGAGQSEVEVADFAHTRVVLCAPGAGDEIQAIKAGVLEIADILVVNKADQALAAQTVALLESMLTLRGPGARMARVLSTTATSGQGVAALVDLLQSLAASAEAAPRRPDLQASLRRLLADAAAQTARRLVLAMDERVLGPLCERVARCEIDLDQAGREVLALLALQSAGSGPEPQIARFG